MRLFYIGTLLVTAFLAMTGCTPSQTNALVNRIILAQEGRIALVDAAGKTTFVTSGPGDLVPAASPDGSMIAFTRVGPADAAGTYVVKTDGTGEKKVAPIVAILTQPVWAPDGKSLAIRDTTKADSMGVWVVKADGSNLQRVFEGDAGPPVWTPDGKSIVVSALEKKADLNLELGIYQVNLQDNSRKLVSPGIYGAIAWAPDGKSIIAMSAGKDGHITDLVVVNTQDGKATALAKAADGTWAPAWAPSGKLLAGIVSANNEQQLVIMSPTGTEAKSLAKGASISTPVWAADGNSLTVALTPAGSKQSKVVRVSTDVSQPAKDLAAGDSPSNLAGTLAPGKDTTAKPQLVGVRRADLKFAKGSWG